MADALDQRKRGRSEVAGHQQRLVASELVSWITRPKPPSQPACSTAAAGGRLCSAGAGGPSIAAQRGLLCTGQRTRCPLLRVCCRMHTGATQAVPRNSAPASLRVAALLAAGSVRRPKLRPGGGVPAVPQHCDRRSGGQTPVHRWLHSGWPLPRRPQASAHLLARGPALRAGAPLGYKRRHTRWRGTPREVSGPRATPRRAGRRDPDPAGLQLHQCHWSAHSPAPRLPRQPPAASQRPKTGSPPRAWAACLPVAQRTSIQVRSSGQWGSTGRR